MNQQTAKKLAGNPHYKMSEKQRREAQEAERPPIIAFGQINRHSQAVPIHNVRMERVARTDKHDTLEKV